jgi:SAM-dependent methyltransferase
VKSVDGHYGSFYRRGGWIYDPEREAQFLLTRIIRPLRISRGTPVLELGCGTGLHAALLQCLGMRVIAIDSCQEAIDRASVFKRVKFLCIDADRYLRDCSTEFDVVYARGMSWFHYELEPGINRRGVNVHAAMALIMSVLRPGGLFVLQIRTNFTGSYDRTGIRHHSWRQSADFLRHFGSVRLLADWNGRPLRSAASARRSGMNLLAAVRRRIR